MLLPSPSASVPISVACRNTMTQRNQPHDAQADHKTANTTMYQPNCCRKNHPTMNRPHASRPKPTQPGMQGSRRERRPMGRRHHEAPHPPTTIPANAPQRRDSTIIKPTNQQQRTTSNPRPPMGGERKLDRVRRREYAPRHASPVARASSSRPTLSENQPRRGCLQDRAFDLAPGPWASESGG